MDTKICRTNSGDINKARLYPYRTEIGYGNEIGHGIIN